MNPLDKLTQAQVSRIAAALKMIADQYEGWDVTQLEFVTAALADQLSGTTSFNATRFAQAAGMDPERVSLRVAS